MRKPDLYRRTRRAVKLARAHARKHRMKGVALATYLRKQRAAVAPMGAG